MSSKSETGRTGPILSRRTLTLGMGAGGAALALAAPADALGGRGWSSSRLEAVKARARALKVTALIVQHQGRVVLSDGDIAKPILLHSMRKSLISALYGNAVARGDIKLDATLRELAIDDDPRLTDIEKGATVRQLLEARSGVYIPAAAEAPTMKARRPARGSHAPGTFWYYNNWDFNVLGNIYERITGKSVFIAIDHEFARPLGWRDWNIFEHTFYEYEAETPRYPAYHMFISARDLMSFGQMYLQQGRWKGAQIVPAAWVKESTTLVSRTNYKDAMGGYGYLWWLMAEDTTDGPTKLPVGAFTAAGAGGHFLTVMPSLDLVVAVHTGDDPKTPAPIADPAAYSAFLRDVVGARA